MLPSLEKVKYHAEYHSKINSITLSIQVPSSGLSCTISPEAVDLIPFNASNHDLSAPIAATNESNVMKVILPALIMPTRTTLDPSSAQSSLLTLKLAALPGSFTSHQSLSTLSVSDFPPAPLPASQLQGLNNLFCGCCGSTLLKNRQPMSEIAMSCGPIQRVVDLPSEYWQELVDCWMCHEEDFTELREGDLGARAEQALIGGTYILIHATDVDQDALIIEDDAQVIDWTKGIKRRWRPLACTRCLHPVADGWYQSRAEDGTDLEMMQVKFHKYMVNFKGTDVRNQLPLHIPQPRFASYLAAEIFESARHHATYRFILQDRLRGEDMILLWMLNWDSTTITNQEPPRDSQIVWDTSLQPDLVSVNLDINHPSTKVSKMMKVLFLGALSREQEDIQKKEGAYSAELKLWDKWRGDPGVERLQFQKPLLLGFLTMLEQSSICQPPSVSSAASTFLAMDCMRIGSIPI
ncbi:hypothetical protein BX616_005609 [Lobosporangium transversale]|nr:hypothetical protein BX616_005609 [Lobosporangium transversale]